jgi:hypothetical protein
MRQMTVGHHLHHAALFGTRRARLGPCPECSPLLLLPHKDARPHHTCSRSRRRQIPRLALSIAHCAKTPPCNAVPGAITKPARWRERRLMRKPCISCLCVIAKVPRAAATTILSALSLLRPAAKTIAGDVVPGDVVQLHARCRPCDAHPLHAHREVRR